MKRRNAETGKMRRPIKRTKITEGMYGNSMLYLKFVMLWAAVVLADYMLEFRFEFLWPFWMMLRSVYDSFKHTKKKTAKSLRYILKKVQDVMQLDNYEQCAFE
ncbi:Macoilin-2 [Plutella xylostella]|uniref:Macoilin n=1 Tax=Plutella xylostella TaxID=51655 RepID=A0ABQ7R5C2_PLUXY|nr:Macoilin-2 [Plutella xylostella]